MSPARKPVRQRLGVLGMSVAIVAAMFTVLLTSTSQAAGTIIVGTRGHSIDGVDANRSANLLIKYTPARGARTGTNTFGFEAAVVGGKVTKIEDGVGNMAIPTNGFVLSGHGTSRTFLRTNATLNAPVSEGTTPAPGGSTPENATKVTIAGPSAGSNVHVINANNARRLSNQLIRYTAAYGTTTDANAYGFEVEIVNQKVTRVQDRVGNMSIPSGNGYVLSAHGTAATWLKANAQVGFTSILDTDGSSPPPPPPPPPPPGGSTGTPRYPDVRVHKLDRTLGQDPSGGHGYFITTSGGARLLKFPVNTANVGDGPLEIRGTRSTTSSVDWVGRQVVMNSDGSSTTLADSGASFYFAGDGHNHWHIRDFDKYELLDSTGQVVRVVAGEKHGYCFEDNTSRDSTWTQAPSGPVPGSPVYANATSCGNGQPNATSIVHGLSVGWGDTYPSTLPDQAIALPAGLPDGTYKVRVTADWQGFWKEKDESNNVAVSTIRITGSQVTFVSADSGL